MAESDAWTVVVAQGGDDCHDGAGWYYWSADYPDEGSVGAFRTRDQAVAHAAEAYDGDLIIEEPFVDPDVPKGVRGA